MSSRSVEGKGDAGPCFCVEPAPFNFNGAPDAAELATEGERGTNGETAILEHAVGWILSTRGHSSPSNQFKPSYRMHSTQVEQIQVSRVSRSGFLGLDAGWMLEDGNVGRCRQRSLIDPRPHPNFSRLRSISIPTSTLDQLDKASNQLLRIQSTPSHIHDTFYDLLPTRISCQRNGQQNKGPGGTHHGGPALPQTPNEMTIRNLLTTSSTRLAKPLRVTSQCIRCLHSNRANANANANATGQTRVSVPNPTPFVPDVPTFLTLIGRGMAKHADKIPSWEKLFTLSSPELREMGIEPTRQRRYLLRKREKFRNGQHGPGGDLDKVVNGVAQLRVVEVPVSDANGAKAGGSTASVTSTPGMKKVIVNLGPEETAYKHPEAGSAAGSESGSGLLKRFAHMKIHQGTMIKGPFLQHIKGSNGSAALIHIQEGMWEDRQGQKVDGGERRQAEVRARKRIEASRKGPA